MSDTKPVRIAGNTADQDKQQQVTEQQQRNDRPSREAYADAMRRGKEVIGWRQP